MKVCVFTAIFSEREPFDKPGVFDKVNGWDYVLFTNLDPVCFESNCSWTIRQVPMPFEHIPKDPAVGIWIYANRLYKWHPQLFLKDYDVVIYVDGFQVPDARQIEEWRGLLGDVRNPNIPTAIVQCPHTVNRCIYDELDAIVIHRKDIRVRMNNLKSYLMSVGYPHKNGLYWNGCYVLDNKNEQMKKVMADLWEDMIKFTYRDQALYVYELWKNNAMHLVRDHNLERMVANLHDCFHHQYTDHSV